MKKLKEIRRTLIQQLRKARSKEEESLTKEFIDIAIKNLTKWLKPKGKFLATYFEGNYGIGRPHKNRKEEYDRVNTNVELYKEICNKYDCEISKEGEFGHIFGQKLILITKK